MAQRPRPYANLNASGGGASYTRSAAASSHTLSTLFAGTSSSWAGADVRAYQQRYPGQKEILRARKNIDFFLNRISSAPQPAGTLDEIHATWPGNYDLLERHHGFIQWIFPIREDGLNSQAQKLYLHEIEVIRADRKAGQRLIRSYEMMLDFYGMRLLDVRTGQVTRNPDNYVERYHHLNRSTHNYLRITRILKCLGELGFEHLKLGFLLHIVRELTEKQLNPNSVGKSARDYWFPILRTSSDLATLQSLIKLLKKEESESQGQPVHLTEERIAQVLQAAELTRQQDKAKLAHQQGTGSDVDDEEEDAEEEGPIAPGGARIRLDSPDSAESDLESIDSPRAAAESMLSSRDSSMVVDVDDSHSGRTEAANSFAAAARPAAAAAAAAPSSSAKRKLDGSEDMADSPQHKKPATPTKDMEERQARLAYAFPQAQD